MRIYAKLSERELAKAANTHQSYISMIENGKTLPSVEVVRRLAKVLMIAAGDLMSRKGWTTIM